MMHDYVWTILHAGIQDVFGHRWGFEESNHAYADIYRAGGLPDEADIRLAALNRLARDVFNP